jgi:hypothetical protein
MMPGDASEVRIRRQKRELEPDAQLGEQRVDRTHLDPAVPAVVTQTGGRDVIVSLWLQEGQGCKPVYDPLPGTGSPETLEQLLQDQSRRVDQLAPFKGTRERSDFRAAPRRIPTQCQRPHARIDEEIHRRERSRL